MPYLGRGCACVCLCHMPSRAWALGAVSRVDGHSAFSPTCLSGSSRGGRARAKGKNPSGTSSGALGRTDFVRPEFIAMLNDAALPADPAVELSSDEKVEPRNLYCYY